MFRAQFYRRKRLVFILSSAWLILSSFTRRLRLRNWSMRIYTRRRFWPQPSPRRIILWAQTLIKTTCSFSWGYSAISVSTAPNKSPKKWDNIESYNSLSGNYNYSSVLWTISTNTLRKPKRIKKYPRSSTLNPPKKMNPLYKKAKKSKSPL